MMPAMTTEDDPTVELLRQAAESALDRRLILSYPAWTFDAGYPASLGIPTLMFGPSAPDASGTGVLDDDVVPEQMVMDAATVYAAFMSIRMPSGEN